MALTVPHVGELTMLRYLVGLANPTNPAASPSTTAGPVLHIYSNDPSVGDNTVIGDTTECTSAGYAAITLVANGWNVSLVSGTTSTASYSQVTFTFTTNAVTYGYYVTDTTTLNGNRGQMLWIERFSGGPYVVPADGGSISVSIKISLA